MESEDLILIDKDTHLIQDRQIQLALERTRLSNERTFLSWFRTSLACIGGGVAIIKFVSFSTDPHKFVARVSGDLLIFIGILFLGFSLYNYRFLKNKITPGSGFKDPTSIFITTICITLMILSTAILWII